MKMFSKKRQRAKSQQQVLIKNADAIVNTKIESLLKQ